MTLAEPAATTGARLVDTMARRFLDAARPRTFRLLRSASEKETAFRLRYRVAVESGWVSPSDLPDGVERDHFDDDALHVGGWASGSLIATMRLVVPSPVRRLPTEEAFTLVIDSTRPVVDWGRVSVAAEHRGPEHRVFWALLARAWFEGRARGFAVVAGVCSEEMIDRYREAALPISILGEPQLHWGELRYPIGIDPTLSPPS